MSCSIPDIVNSIYNFKPFKCDNLDDLCEALVMFFDTYSPQSDEYVKTLCSKVKSLEKIKLCSGSWNIPLFDAKFLEKPDNTYYKVFRKSTMLSDDECYKQLSYEFHKGWVTPNEWLQAEVSQSKGLTGLKPKEEGGSGGRFHLLYDHDQAMTYLESRVDEDFLSKSEAVIATVNARNLQTLDLVYIPPNNFVWGVDAKEIYVKL